MELDGPTTELLRPAAERLRRALQKFDPDDVPASLRRFADSSARRIPPPLLKRALSELDDSEWLRAEAAEGEPALTPDSPEGLFLLRPEGWESRLSDLSAESDERDLRRHASRLEREIRQQAKQMSQLEARLAAATSARETAEQEAARHADEKLAAAERARQRAEGSARDAARQVERLERRCLDLEREVDEAQDRVEVLRQMLERERRAAEPALPATDRRGWFPDDPDDMAAELDRISLAIRRPPPEPSAAAEVPEPLRLPPGVRPDRREAVVWLLGRPVRWLLDGYNVAFQLGGDPDAVTRQRVVTAASQLVARSAPGATVTVVFDSSIDQASIPTARRVVTIFAESADEWILQHAGDGAVVVTSDRRVREGSEALGAVGIWSEGLVGWIEAGYPIG